MWVESSPEQAKRDSPQEPNRRPRSLRLVLMLVDVQAGKKREEKSRRARKIDESRF